MATATQVCEQPPFKHPAEPCGTTRDHAGATFGKCYVRATALGFKKAGGVRVNGRVKNRREGESKVRVLQVVEFE
jgi:hypothetical protein